MGLIEIQKESSLFAVVLDDLRNRRVWTQYYAVQAHL